MFTVTYLGYVTQTYTEHALYLAAAVVRLQDWGCCPPRPLV